MIQVRLRAAPLYAMRSRLLLIAAVVALVATLPVAVRAQTNALIEEAEGLIAKENLAGAEAVLARAVRLQPANSQALYRLAYVEFRLRKLTAARGRLLAVIRLAPPAHNARYFLGRVALLENKPREAADWLAPVVAAAAREGPSVDAASQLALAYAGAGLPRQAVQPLQLAIAEAPWDGALYYRLGRLHQQLGEPELARQAFQTSDKLKSTTREDVERLMETARLIAEGRSGEAETAGAQILGREDADPNSLVALGVVYGRANLAAQAAAAFERAVRRDPALFAAQYNYGLALLRAGRQSEALEPLERAVVLLPQSPEASLTYGLAAVMNQRYAEAIAPLERLMKLPPTAPPNERVPLLLATAYLRTGAAAKAVPLLRKPANQDPGAAMLLVEALAAATRDQAGALEAALAAGRRFPQSPEAQAAAAQQLTRAGRYREARPAFEAALALAPPGRPPRPEVMLGLADSMQKSGEHDASLGHYRAALANASTELPARLGLARSLVALRQLPEARRTLEQGLEAHSDDVALRLELSRVYARLGEKDLAAHEARIVEQLQQRSAAKP